MTSRRTETGGRIDRFRTIRFTFDGASYTGHPGDTLASALLASGVSLFGRSFKYHRPRGVLTAGVDDSALLEAKSLKVQGIVLKNSDPAYLIECLESVRGGRTWIDPELATRARQLAAAPQRARHLQLAPRERQLIGFVRKGLRNREIAEQLGVTEGTVKVYLHAIFEKLGVATRTELAIRADEFLVG